jgi:hypothetical protein
VTTRIRRLPPAMRRRAAGRTPTRVTTAEPPWRPGHYDGPTTLAGQLTNARFLATGIVPPIYRNKPGACLSLIMMAQALDIPRATAAGNIYWNLAVGRGATTAQLMAALLTRHGYDFKVTEETDQRVAMTFYRTIDGRRRKLGHAEWTILEAIGACLTWRDQWRHYPKDMLWARCLMRGARRYASHVGTGLAYTIDEIDDMSAAAGPGQVHDAVQEILDKATAEGTTADEIRTGLVKLATKRGLIDADTGEGEPLGKVLGLLWGQKRAAETDTHQTSTEPPDQPELAAPAGTGTLPCGCPAAQVLRTGTHNPAAHHG